MVFDKSISRNTNVLFIASDIRPPRQDEPDELTVIIPNDILTINEIR